MATQQPSTAPDLNDPMNPVNIQDPFPLYGRLREERPVHWSQYSRSWILTRFEDVRSALNDQVRFSSNGGAPLLAKAADLPASVKTHFDVGFRFFYRQIQTADPPAHTAQRALIAKAFTPRVIESMREAIQDRVDHLIDNLQQVTTCDLVSQFAYPLPSLVILDLLGIPEEHYQTLRTSAAAFARFPPAFISSHWEELERIAELLTTTQQLLIRLLSERRKHPQNDLLSALVNSSDENGGLTDEELVVLSNFLLFAGHETTANLIGGSVFHLLQNRDLWNELKEAPELLANGVEELLRFVSPVLSVSRVLTDDFECRGTRLNKGDRVSLVIGSANHDPAEFRDADKLDLHRPKPHSVAFGYGIHYCIGAALARMETQIALSTLLRRMPEMCLDADKVEYQPVFFLRSLKALPIRTSGHTA